MTEKTGDQYYYSRGYIRLLAKMDDRSLRVLKGLAIEKDQSIMEVTKDALEQFLAKPDAFPKEFAEMANGSALMTFIPRELHKKFKIVATRDFGKHLGDLSGFVLSKWAREQSGEAWGTPTTQNSTSEDFRAKVQKLQAAKADAPETIPTASGPN